MEIRTLRYFLAVAQEENMTRAAARLHLTQPTLSKALKSLEAELDARLFIRHSFSIELTDEGRLLRDRARDLVGLADKIEGVMTGFFKCQSVGKIAFATGNNKAFAAGNADIMAQAEAIGKKF